MGIPSTADIGDVNIIWGRTENIIYYIPPVVNFMLREQGSRNDRVV